MVEIDPSLKPLPSAIQTSETSKAILHGDLSIQLKWLPTTITSFTIKNGTQFAALRRCLSQSIYDVGIRKRPPNNTDLKEGRHTFNLQPGDIVHLVDANLEGLDDEACNCDWFPEDAVQRHSYFNSQRNYVKLRYDSRLQ